MTAISGAQLRRLLEEGDGGEVNVVQTPGTRTWSIDLLTPMETVRISWSGHVSKRIPTWRAKALDYNRNQSARRRAK